MFSLVVLAGAFARLSPHSRRAGDVRPGSSSTRRSASTPTTSATRPRRFFTLDRVVRQEGWFRFPQRTSPTRLGRRTPIVATVSDPATRVVLFSKAYDSYFGEYRTTAAAESGVRRTFHESVLIPCPKRTVRFGIAVRQRDGSLRELFATMWTRSANHRRCARPLDRGRDRHRRAPQRRPARPWSTSR